MYTLIGRMKWYYQVLITILFIAAIITCYLFARSWGYDKARREFEVKDKAKAEESAKKIARAEELERRVAELEPKLAAYEKLADDKKRIDDSISGKIDKVVEEGKKEDETTNTPVDCWIRAQRTCSKFAQLNPPILIDCEAYKRKICSNPDSTGAPGRPCGSGS